MSGRFLYDRFLRFVYWYEVAVVVRRRRRRRRRRCRLLTEPCGSHNLSSNCLIHFKF